MIEQYLTAKASGGRYVGRPGSPRTIQSYREALLRAQTISGIPLQDVTEIDTDSFMEHLAMYAPATRAHTLAALRGFYTWAIASKRMSGPNPFEHVTTGKVNRKIPRILSKADVNKLLEALPCQKYQLFFSLMYYGGMRIGEVTSLLREDIREDGVVVRGKGDKQRYVYLPQKIHALLITYLSTQPTYTHVFVGRLTNQAMDPSHAYMILKDALSSCGLSDVRAHNLRHTSATHFHMATGDLARTQTFLGHSSPTTTMIYVQVADEAMKAASKMAFGD